MNPCFDIRKTPAANAPLSLYRLRTDHREDPVGIDAAPEFSWMLQSSIRDTEQTAYRLKVFADGAPVWDSGRQESAQNSFVPYGGPSLSSRTLYIWQVEVWDNHGHSACARASFETAFLARSDWAARWIEAAFERPAYPQDRFWPLSPAVCFEKSFSVYGELRRARLYATAHGVYRAELNGLRPDEREFAPEHTVYDRILYYQTYPVEHCLRQGENLLRFTVADGWYHGVMTRQEIRGYTGLPALLFQLEIEYADGRRQTVCSRGGERCRENRIRWADLFLGEKQELTLPEPEAHAARQAAFALDDLRAQPTDPVRPLALLPAAEVYTSPRGEHIVDFGQLLCGRARVWIDAPSGTEIIFDYFEIPDRAGNYRNTMFAPQRDILVTDGTPRLYEAAFTFHGFRYLRVTGLPSLRREDFTAVALSSAKESVGSFACSDARLNRLYENIRWSQANNTLSIPTDCPSREKAGFTGDIQIYAPTALGNEQMTPFLSGWLRNLEAAQAENGAVPITVPETAPYLRLMKTNAEDFGDAWPVGVAGWSDAAVLVPWAMYRATGNARILDRQFESMRRWCGYIERASAARRGRPDLPEDEDRLLWNTGFHFGEWLIPSEEKNRTHREACEGSAWYTAPIFGYASLHTMAQVCRVLGKPEEAHYSEQAKRVKLAVQRALIRDGKLLSGSMGAYVLMLAFDLVPPELTSVFTDRLCALIRENGDRLDTGFLATPYLLDVLSRNGRGDVAAALLMQTSCPSWLYEVEQGATAVWESWDALRPGEEPDVTSYDHYAFGCVDAWIMAHVAGIRALTPGYGKVEIRPEPELFPLRFCKRSLLTEHGELSVAWDERELRVTVPCGVRAEIYWKDNRAEVGSGEYCFC